MYDFMDIARKAKETLINAGSGYRNDQIQIYKNAIANESNQNAKWVLENFLDNFLVAGKNKSPLCDDTGIPHIMLEVGRDSNISHELLEAINEGVAQGLRELPGRPMAVKGNDIERLEQSKGLYDDPGMMQIAPIHLRTTNEKGLKLHILLQGGGPEIRGKTYRIFHRHNISNIINEIIEWAVEGASKLGCTPCTPAIGIGRSHFEASSLMLEAMIRGNFLIQSDIEREITDRINQSGTGPLGLGGNNTALATFLKIGPQRASGVRIVCLRLCCGVEPRLASCDL